MTNIQKTYFSKVIVGLINVCKILLRYILKAGNVIFIRIFFGINNVILNIYKESMMIVGLPRHVAIPVFFQSVILICFTSIFLFSLELFYRIIVYLLS